MGAAQAREHTFEHDLLADDQALNALFFFDPYRPVDECFLKIIYPKISRLKHM